MDLAQDELEFVGFFDMCSESIKIISSCKKIFLRITLTLILPLSVIFLSHGGISTFLITKIIFDLDELQRTKNISYDEISDALNIEYIEFWISEVAYFTFLIAFSLFSTSTVVYTVACVHSNVQTTYKKVMSFALTIWNRLIVTLLCNFTIFIAYNIATLQILYVIASFFPEGDVTITTRLVFSTIYVVYFAGFIYISVIWQLASVISVLEESYGFEAISKSKALMKGKMGISAAIFLEINLCFGCIQLLFDKFVVFEESFGVIGKIGFGGLFLMLRSLLFLFGLVVQTVIYFACKSSANNSYLSKYFNIYLGSYFSLDSIMVEIEQV